MTNFLRRELLYALIIMIGPLNFGFVMGFPSPAIPQWEKEWKSISQMQTTWFNAIASLFAVIGPFIVTILLNYLGRRPVVCMISSLCLVLWCIMLAVNEKRFALGIVLRVFLGLCVGAYSSISPMLLVEVAPKDITGFFGSLNQIAIVIGIIIMYLQGNWADWSTLCYTGIAACVLQIGLIWLIPETRPEKVTQTAEDGTTEKDTIFQKKYLGKLLVGIGMMIFQQFSGINALITNLDKNFRDAGAPLDSGIASAISVAAQLLAVFLGGFLVDWIGRRPLFCVSALGCGICLFLFALNTKFGWANWFSIVLIFLYMFAFGAALGPIPWFVIPELFPGSVRSAGASIISSVNWICAFIVIFVYPPLRDAITNVWTLVIFGIIICGGSVFGFFYITEPPKGNESLDWDAGENEAASSTNI